MTEVWLLAGLAIVVVLAIVGIVMLALSRDVPDEMSERWRRENERDRGKS
jgi:uncharacterized membrane protein